MIADYLSRDEISSYVSALRSRVASGDLDDHAAPAAKAIGRDADNAQAAILAALPVDGAGDPSSGGGHVNLPFFSRDPAVSLMQTSLEIEARKADLVHEAKPGEMRKLIVGVVEELKDVLPERFSTKDPEWVTRVGEATLDRLAKGNHPFNRTPAEYVIDRDDARVVIVGDWGSGLVHARDVAGFMAAEVADGLGAGRPVHVIHLGDVYYSGDPEEVRRRFLADGLWPVTADQFRQGVTSWSLNGNHDMYGGGWGYFQTLLRDERFTHQRSSPDGEPTSFFRIRTPSWDLVGLDTSWSAQVLSKGLRGDLVDPQNTVLADWAAESERKVMLLSHHQFVSSYDLGDVGTVLSHKLGPLLQDNRITAWLWGHEHRCMGFKPASGPTGVPFMRCIGHGGVPIPATAAGAEIPPPGVWQIPTAGDAAGVFEEHAGSWNRFGFAVLDFAGAQATIRYRDDQGNEVLSEPLP